MPVLVIYDGVGSYDETVIMDCGLVYLMMMVCMSGVNE